MTQSFWQRKHSSVTRNLKGDTVIIGGGLVGLSTAFWLSELKPESRIIVIERRNCGAGASGKNAGFLTKGSAFFYQKLIEQWGVEKALSIYQFAASSLQLLNQRILSTSPEIKFQRTTSVTLLRDKLIDLPPAFQFTSGEMNLPASFSGSLVCADEYKVNPVDLIQSLKGKLLARNVQIVEDTTGFSINKNLVLTNLNQIHCENIVLAVNGYSGEFSPELGEIIKPARAQMLAVEIESGSPWSESLFYDPSHRVYFRQSAENILLLGGKRLLDEKVESSSTERISPIIQEGLEEYLRQELCLKYKVINRWSGIMGFTGHELPYICPVEGETRTILAAGFSGHGMGFGFRAGKEAAELVLGLSEKSFFSEFGDAAVKRRE